MNSIGFLADEWPRRTRRTDDVVRAQWREVSRFGGKDAADRAFAIWKTDSRQAEDFCNAIKMGDAYYLAYEDADEVVDPDLLYYGSMWLGLAAAYLCLGQDQTSKKVAGHGLDVSFDFNKTHPILNANVKIGNRRETFSLITRAFGGDEISGESFQMIDYLRAVPELDPYLRDITGGGTSAMELSLAAGLRIDDPSPGPRQHWMCVVDRDVSDPYLRDNIMAYDYLKLRGLTIDDHDKRGLMWARTRTIADELTAVSVEAVGGTRYFAPKLRKFSVPEFSIYLAILFTLSRLVRYHPGFWLRTNEKLTDEHFLIRQFIDVAQRKVPNLLLNHLTKSTFEFVTA